MNKTAPEQSPETTGKRDPSDLILVFSIATIAFLLRLIYLLEISVSPFFENLVIDCLRYSDRGREIAAGDWLGSGVFYQSPLYAYFLGFIYRFITTDLFLVRALQAVIGSGSCVLIFLVSRRLFGRPAGAISGFLAAGFAPFIYYDGMVMKTVLSIFLAALGLHLLLKAMESGRVGTWLACGATWGAAGLVRENYLLIGAIFGAWLLAGHLRRSGRSEEKGLWPLWFYLAGLALVILPVTIRNVVIGEEFALVTSQAGQNFYIGNNPHNRSGAYEVPEFIIANPYYEEKSFREFAQKTTGREMSSREVSAFYRDKALSWMWKNPGSALALTGRKFLLFFNNYEVADNQSIYFMKRYSLLLKLNILGFGLIAPLGLLGLGLLWKKRKGAPASLYIFSITYSATVIAFFIFGRYRLPVTVVLLPCAGFACTEIYRYIRGREYKILTKCAVALACLYGFVYLPAYEYHDETMAMRFINLGQIHVRLSKSEYRQDDLESSVNEMQLALQAYSEAGKLLPRAAEPHIYMARALTLAGKPADAAGQYRKALRKAPGLLPVRLELALLLYENGAPQQAYDEVRAILSAEPDNAQALLLLRNLEEWSKPQDDNR